MTKTKDDVKIDVTQTLNELDGTPLVRLITEACDVCGAPLEKEDWTLRKACTDALTKPVVKGVRQDGTPVMEEAGSADHMDRWILAMKIHKHEKIALTEKDIELIKNRCAKMFPTVIAGQVGWKLKGKEEG
jgi:hypothetical protein